MRNPDEQQRIVILIRSEESVVIPRLGYGCFTPFSMTKAMHTAGNRIRRPRELTEVYEQERENRRVTWSFECWLRRRAQGHLAAASDAERQYCLKALRTQMQPEQGGM